jgi:hypothetical protein
MTSGTWPGRAGVLLLAAAAQAAVLGTGFFSTAADESARALRAADVGVGDVIRPDVWLPFDKLLVGLALHVHRDLFVTPRVVTFLAGLAVVWALMALAHRLFRDRPTTLLAGIVGAVVPVRLLLGVAPMSDVYLFLFTLLAAGALFAWIETERTRHVLLAAAWIAVATSVRYEAWVVAASFAAMLGWRIVSRSARAPLPLALAAVIALAYPLVWLTANVLWPSDIHYLSIVRQQALVKEPSLIRLLYNTAGAQFALDLVRAPGLIVGALAFAGLVGREGPFRWWALVLFAPLAIVTVSVVLLHSVGFATEWRFGGTWTLLLLPFFAHAVVRLWRAAGTRMRAVVVVALLALVLVPLAGRSAWLAARSTYPADGSRVADVELGRELGRRIADRGGRVLVEVAGYRWLDVIVASNRPEAFAFDRGRDPFYIALFVERTDRWERRAPALVQRYLAPNYDLARPVDPARLACEGIHTVVTGTPGSAAAARTVPGLVPIARVGQWTVFDLRKAPAGCPAPRA